MGDDSAARDYDSMVDYASFPTETEATVHGLGDLVDERARVLELGVGTGRLAIPLAQRVGEMHGVELDPEMVHVLAAKPGSELVQVHVGDMSQVLNAGFFDLIFIAFGTLFALPTQDAQVRCFMSAAEQLAEGGIFVVEALVPQPGSYIDGQKSVVSKVADDEVLLTVSLLDEAEQTLTTQQLLFADSSIKLHPNRIRYAWPCELDLMARIAGLQLRARWSDWRRTPFVRGSRRHISVYAR